MNKSLLKATAIAVCFALLLLAFPDVIQAKPRTSRHFYEKFIRTPFAMIVEFISFMPIVDFPVFQAPTDRVTNKTVSRRLTKNMKVTGGLSSQRPSKED
jgi:hypothetical protein